MHAGRGLEFRLCLAAKVTEHRIAGASCLISGCTSRPKAAKKARHDKTEVQSRVVPRGDRDLPLDLIGCSNWVLDSMQYNFRRGSDQPASRIRWACQELEWTSNVYRDGAYLTL